MSRDYPFREIGNSEFGSPGDERSGLSMVETRSSCGPSDLRRLRVKRLTTSGNRGLRIRESHGRELGLS
jgi:hypothetical protein